MKKTLAVILVAILSFVFVACGIEREYYVNTNVPTFTCVTGITGSRTSSDGLDIYTYSCNERKKESLAEKYMDYLKKECNFATVSSSDDYEFITLAGDGWGVIVDATQEGTIRVLPYKRAN